jgi:two-component system, response regulator YesN
MTTATRPTLPSAIATHAHRLVWVDLTHSVGEALSKQLTGGCCIQRVTDPLQIEATIHTHTPQFLCFEFDEPDAQGMNALAHTRLHHPSLPVLMFTGCHSEAVAIWALRMRVWDLLVKPLSCELLNQRISMLTALTCGPRPRAMHETLYLPQVAEDFVVSNGYGEHEKTHPAIAHVVQYFDDKIKLSDVAAMCHCGTTQFCRIFRQEHGQSFHQYLLHYRIDQACDRLANPNSHAKDVAYDVGFNDLSYFARAFKRHVGVCPSQYHLRAR